MRMVIRICQTLMMISALPPLGPILDHHQLEPTPLSSPMAH
jgi:hypothetical protein